MNWQSTQMTKVVGGLSLAAVAGLGWLVALGPQFHEVADIHAQIETTRTQNDNGRLKLAKLQAQSKNLVATRAMARGLAARFPATADQPKLFRTMTEAGARAGIVADDLTELTPAAPLLDAPAGTGTGAGTGGTGTGGTENGTGTGAGEGAGTGKPPVVNPASGKLASQAVGISVEGSYDQIQRLLENLEGVERAYLVTSLTLGTGSKPDTFTAAITGQMFVMPAAVDPALAPAR